MMKLQFVLMLLFTLLVTCQKASDESNGSQAVMAEVQIVGSMKEVMWKGKLGGQIYLDTISDKKGLYGLGPKSGLQGELLVVDGISYISSVDSQGAMQVKESFDVTAPFFVYANVRNWKERELPPGIRSISDLEKFLDHTTRERSRPFAFKLVGSVATANIHTQNLAAGTSVNSPQQAHQGQVNYRLADEEVEVIGFFSTQHQGIFTHHDSFLHMHLINSDKSKMGHVDALDLGKMRLFLPN